MDWVAPEDPWDPLTHFMYTHKWLQVQGQRERDPPVVAHAKLGLLVLGSAPPPGQAAEWARGFGQHRFVQNPRGALEDITALRTAPLQDADNMMELLPDADGLLGMDAYAFMDEYPDDFTPKDKNDRLLTVTADGREQGGADDQALWVNSPWRTGAPPPLSTSPLHPHVPQSVFRGLPPDSQLLAAAKLAQSTVFAHHSPTVVLLQGDRQSFLFGVQLGHFLADCFEPYIAMIADGHLTLVIAVPDPAMVRYRVGLKEPYQQAMGTLFEVLHRHVQPSTSGPRLLFSPPRTREELVRLRDAIKNDESMRSILNCRMQMLEVYGGEVMPMAEGSSPSDAPPPAEEHQSLLELSDRLECVTMDSECLLQHAIDTFQQSGAQQYGHALSLARRACTAGSDHTAWAELPFRRKLLVALAAHHHWASGGAPFLNSKASFQAVDSDGILLHPAITFTGCFNGKSWRCRRGTVPGTPQYESFLRLEKKKMIPEGRDTFQLTKQTNGEYHAVLCKNQGFVRAVMLGGPVKPPPPKDRKRKRERE
jgi:hypothetical protein